MTPESAYVAPTRQIVRPTRLFKNSNVIGWPEVADWCYGESKGKATRAIAYVFTIWVLNVRSVSSIYAIVSSGTAAGGV